MTRWLLKDFLQHINPTYHVTIVKLVNQYEYKKTIFSGKAMDYLGCKCYKDYFIDSIVNGFGEFIIYV